MGCLCSIPRILVFRGQEKGKMGDLAVFIATYVLLFQKLCVDLHDILFFKLLSQFIV